ncbi:MAG: Xaa-Pro peptidase family protein [bacterium]|nr:Xaa-Pro peptidase family protein [bacterium]
MGWPEERINRAFRVAQARKLDALLFFSPEFINYFSGFRGEGILALGSGKGFLVSDGRYLTQAREEAPEFEFRLSRSWLSGTAELIGEKGFARVGFEAEGIPYIGFQRLKELSPGWELCPLDEELKKLRMVKEPGEIERIRRALAIAEQAFEQIRPRIRSGGRERDIALEFEYAARRLGSENLPFDPIVASGPRSALPHAIPSDRLLGEEELIIVDYGARAEGYASDQTRTAWLGNGRGGREEIRIYQAVQAAQREAIAAVRPGVPARVVDRAARGRIAAGGWGEFFRHSTGHGVGLAVHEAPTISEDSDVILEPGMVFTIEPGIYIPELGGVRIEDMVLVTAEGAEVLTSIRSD